MLNHTVIGTKTKHVTIPEKIIANIYLPEQSIHQVQHIILLYENVV